MNWKSSSSAEPFYKRVSYLKGPNLSIFELKFNFIDTAAVQRLLEVTISIFFSPLSCDCDTGQLQVMEHSLVYLHKPSLHLSLSVSLSDIQTKLMIFNN